MNPHYMRPSSQSLETLIISPRILMTATKNQRGIRKSKFNPYGEEEEQDYDDGYNSLDNNSRSSSFDKVPIYKDTMEYTDYDDGEEPLK
jgi:hypothetical protein